MAEIKTPSGHIILADDADMGLLSQYRWMALFQNKGRPYAARVVKWDPRVYEYMHRFLMGPSLGMFVDHINGNGLDNRRCNLRVCTHAENMRNRKTSGGKFKGVISRKDNKRHPWAAAIMLNGKTYHLGYFSSEEVAAKAYDAAARMLHGAFANLNFPEAGA